MLLCRLIYFVIRYRQMSYKKSVLIWGHSKVLLGIQYRLNYGVCRIMVQFRNMDCAGLLTLDNDAFVKSCFISSFFFITRSWKWGTMAYVPSTCSILFYTEVVQLSKSQLLPVTALFFQLLRVPSSNPTFVGVNVLFIFLILK